MAEGGKGRVQIKVSYKIKVRVDPRRKGANTPTWYYMVKQKSAMTPSNIYLSTL